MRRATRSALSLAVAGTLAFGFGADASAGGGAHHGGQGHHAGHGHPGGYDRLSLRQLVGLWVSTARYHRVDAALASGRIDLDLCFDQMGEHYADPATFSDGVVDPLRPEALVYEHVGTRLRLVAVEWVSTTPATMAGIPLHLNESLGVYVLHAWIWKHNPDGMLADFNPAVGDCPMG